MLPVLGLFKSKTIESAIPGSHLLMRKRFAQLTTGENVMSEFLTVTNTADLAPGEMKLVDFDGEAIAIANVDGEYFAFNNTCPHIGGPLAEGELEGDIVTCPWHATPFNVRTGEAQEGGVTNIPVTTYEVRLEGDDIQIRKA